MRSPARAATITAASCQQAAVASAIASAQAGDTVNVPAGSCSWSGLSIAKAIHLKGAGIGQTAVAVSGNSITKQAAGVVRISSFSFTKSGGGNASKAFDIGGSWKGAEPVIIENNAFTTSNSGLLRIGVVGGVLIAGNTFRGDWDDSFIQPKAVTDAESWSTADTMGAKDTTGKLNLYVENNTFYGGTNQGIDCDDGSRCVYRYNTLTYSSFNSHGLDTSQVGIRHFEIYNNTFKYPPFSGSPPTNDVTNTGWFIWIRGGTGTIFGNSLDDIKSSWWGDPTEIKFNIRGAEDARPQGTCSQVHYPVPRQLGQSHNGASYVTDPIYVWGNTGTQAWSAGWNWGNPCGLNFNDFFQSGRDYVNGTAKPGYQPYTYPHPLRTSVPSVPANVFHVRAGAAGNNSGSDWTNACPEFIGACAVSSLVRGATYYVSDGTYAGRTWDRAASGTSVITVRKATLADHGSSAGWLAVYGDGQATWTGRNIFSTGYWTFDGVSGDYAAGGLSSYGFRFDYAEGGAGAKISGDGVTLKYIDCDGISATGNYNYAAQAKCIEAYGGNNWTVSHLAMHGCESCIQGGGRNWTVEYSYFFNSRSTSPNFHNNLFFASAA